MKIILPALAVMMAGLCAAAAEVPRKWVDPATGHRVIRLTDEPDSATLYFNQNGYTADLQKMIYTTPEGISAYSSDADR